jgi:hypothetical protein
MCQKRNDYVFDNELVKDISKKVGFGNPFDVTKLDNMSKLPQIFLENDYAVIHLGSGRHQFITTALTARLLPPIFAKATY